MKINIPLAIRDDHSFLGTNPIEEQQETFKKQVDYLSKKVAEYLEIEELEFYVAGRLTNFVQINNPTWDRMRDEAWHIAIQYLKKYNPDHPALHQEKDEDED